MAEIIVVGYQEYDFAKSLVVGEVRYEDLNLDLSSYDGLIFTSKNAIFALQNNALKHPQMQIWRNIPSYVIGLGSAKVLQNFGGNLTYISSNAHGKEFASELIKTLQKEKKYAYFRAKEIVSGLDKTLLESGFNLDSFFAYSTYAKKLCISKKPKEKSILLFTSPSAYRFFLQNFSWDSSYKAIAIGKTTFQSFDSTISKEISPIQDIKESVKLLQSHFGD